MKTFAFHLFAPAKLGPGSFYCQAVDENDAWKQFEAAISSLNMKIFRNYKADHFTADVLVPEGYDEPQHDSSGLRRSWFIDVEEIQFGLLTWR